MHLNVFTAFSGYDSQCLALQRMAERHPDFTFDLVGWSEIDRYAICAHNALFPQWSDRNLGDIAKIDWTSVPDFDLFTYSSPCTDFSQAGRQLGGEEGSGTRSSLLWECRKAIIAKKPKFLVFENVKPLVGKKFMPLFQKWLDELASYGYINYFKVINSKDQGIPQNRERVILVSFLEPQSFKFPDNKPLLNVLRDMLEENVDERYYLDQAKVDAFIAHCDKKLVLGAGNSITSQQYPNSPL